MVDIYNQCVCSFKFANFLSDVKQQFPRTVALELAIVDKMSIPKV